MALAGSLQLSHDLGLCKSHCYNKQFKSAVAGRGQRHLIISSFSFKNSFQRRDSLGFRLADTAYRPISPIPHKYNNVRCHSSVVPDNTLGLDNLKIAAVEFVRSLNNAQSGSPVHKLLPAMALILFTIWGLGPLLQQSRNLLFHKNDSSWKKSKTHYVLTSYFQPLLLWTGVLLICRALDPVVLPTEASQVVKQRLLHFIGSLSTVLVFAYCLSSMVHQAQKFYMESNDSDDTRKMGFDFAGKAVYTAVWVGAISLFMELLGFSTQKWLTAGGLGTVLLTLAGREIFTNFLSSAMIHATRPFVVNEWIQTRIEGYDVSGTVEHVGWWSPTIVRGEDREAVHIPNHKFTMNVVRNLTQKTHWRIKTHLAISHLDVKKINNIVADMRKVLAKNPQVEQQKLHRRVFLENVNAENQALLILISCFVKTSHFEEYLCVKEGILLDLLRVISHHRARLATPIRTVQKIYSDPDLDNVPFAESIFSRGGGVAPNRPLLLIEPSYKINGEEKAKTQPRSARPTGEQDTKSTPKPPSDNNKTDAATAKVVEKPASDIKVDPKSGEEPSPGMGKEPEAPTPPPNPKVSEKVTTKATSATTPVSKSNPNVAEMSTSDISQTNQSKKPSASNSKASESQAPSQAPTRPAMEENILLEVVLEGSKRTLPIDEEMGTTPEEAKELAAHRSKNGSQAADKDKKDGSQVSSAPDSAAPGDQ